jgi:BirA family biotin operon repressor/biotin-[acetyl-CoA-carboxylase] ligase
MPTRADLLRLLADGRFHSGTDLGQRLGVSRAAVCKGIRGLTDMGLHIHRLAGRGYRLEADYRPLDATIILAHAAPVVVPLDLLEEIDSTNHYLLQRADIASGAVCLAEAQRAGRGRRGRGWIATPYSNVLLSMAWRFDAGPAMTAGLSLAAGVAVLQALHEYGVSGVGLKWPNDVLAQGRKLAGLLVDVRGEAGGPSLAILGLGLNVHMADADAERIDQPWIDLKRVHGDVLDRSRLAGLLIRHLHAMFTAFARDGLAPFVKDWEEHHLYTGQQVRVMQGERVQIGIARGIDAQGALVLEDTTGARSAVFSGEVTLRPQ